MHIFTGGTESPHNKSFPFEKEYTDRWKTRERNNEIMPPMNHADKTERRVTSPSTPVPDDLMPPKNSIPGLSSLVLTVSNETSIGYEAIVSGHVPQFTVNHGK